MTPDTFIAQFDILAEAPGGVPKLRELILQLAVRGQLVMQDPRDEPAEALLNAIQTERAKRIRDGSLREESDPMPPTLSWSSAPIPIGWVIRDFGSLVFNRDSERVPVSKTDREKRRGEFDYYGASGVIDKIDDYLFDHQLLLVGEDGANLVNRSTPIAFVAAGKYWVNNHAHVLETINNDLLNYLTLFINATDLRPYITGTAQPKMNQAKMNSIPVALPPLAEQKRIVARVNELLQRCDELEARQKERNERHTDLVSSCFHAISSKPETSSFHLQPSTFNILLTSPESVVELRKTILQLAVQGRLVKQDPKDEPAACLLAHIAQTVSAGSGGKELQNAGTQESRRTAALANPPSWQWMTLGDLRPEFQNGVSKRASQTGVPTPVLRLANIVNGAVSLDKLRYIPLSAQEREKYSILPTDILITRVNGSVDLVGAFTHVRVATEAAYCDHFIRMRLPQPFVLPEFVSLFGRSALCRSAIERLFITTAGQKTVNQGHINSLSLPLPPLAEQKRIVAKVNELMTLCDALEAKLIQSRADADTLTAAMVHRLCNTTAPSERVLV